MCDKSIPIKEDNVWQNDIWQNELLTVTEVAEYLRVSRTTVWRWCQRGVIPAFQIGRSWRIHSADLRDLPLVARRRRRLNC